MKANAALAIACATFAVAAAHAEAHHSAWFEFTTPPALQVDGAPADPANDAGRWTGPNQLQAHTQAQDLSTDPGSGASAWGPVQALDASATDAGAPLGGPATQLDLAASDPGLRTTGQAGFGPAGLRAATSLLDPQGQGGSSASWARSFELNAHASVTLSGVWRFDVSGSGTAPLDLAGSFELQSDDAPPASNPQEGRLSAGFRLYDSTGRVGGLITGTLDRVDLASEPFSHGLDESGQVALTITNPSDQALRGHFGLQAFTAVAAVPEPAGVWTLLAGLGLLGVAAARRGRPVRDGAAHRLATA